MTHCKYCGADLPQNKEVREITKKDFWDCIEKHNFFNSDCYSECMDDIREDLQNNFKNKIVCDYAFASDTKPEDLIDYVMYCCQDRLIKGWLSFYENEFVFWLIEYVEG